MSKKKFITLSILILIGNYNFAQSVIKESIINNAKQIEDFTNKSAMQKIGDAIGDARIVMLGEQDHGDGSTFLVKASLIKYLHEEKGFDVLAFETEMYSMNYAWDEVLQNKISIDSAIMTSIFPVWTNCQQCNETFTYIHKTQSSKNPIVLTGFDDQFLFKSSRIYFKNELISYLNQSQIAFTKTLYFRDQFPNDIDSMMKIFRFNRDNKKEKIELLTKMVDTLNVIKSQLKKSGAVKDYFSLLIENCISFSQEITNIYQNKTASLTDDSRDKQMAENLAWLIKNKFNDKKIIVWAANSHVVRNHTNDFSTKFFKAPSM